MRDAKGPYTLHAKPDAEPSAPPKSPPPPVAPPFVPHTAFVHYMIQQQRETRLLLRKHIVDVNSRLTTLEASQEQSRREVHELYSFTAPVSA